MLRGALVLAVGALDGLVLEATIEAVAPVSRGGGLGANVSKWVKDEPDRFVAILATGDPHAELTTIAREHLSSITFQRSQTIEAVLRDVAGCNPPWDRAARKLTKPGQQWDAELVKSRLDKYVDRRHRIVHSGDLEDGQRATPITVPYVRDATDVIEAVGLAVCYVVGSRIRQSERAARQPA